MATVNSNLVANNVAIPRVLNEVRDDGARTRCISGFLTSAAAFAAGDDYVLAHVPSNAKILEIRAAWEDWGTAAVASVGIAELGKSATDIDGFASLIVLGTAQTTMTDLRFESGAAAGLVSRANEQAWELFGATTDPGGYYQIVMQITTSTTPTTGSLMVFQIYYTID